VRLAGGAGLAAAEGSAGARVTGRLGREGEREVWARGRERGVWAGNGPDEGGVFSFFFF
jgi:hypothetical protein